jgi:hypothetical protein
MGRSAATPLDLGEGHLVRDPSSAIRTGSWRSREHANLRRAATARINGRMGGPSRGSPRRIGMWITLATTEKYA